MKKTDSSVQITDDNLCAKTVVVISEPAPFALLLKP